MPRHPKPYFKKSHCVWYVKINGVHHPLGKDEGAAWERYYKLMAGRRDMGPNPSVLEILDEFLVWASVNLADTSYDFYKRHCDLFAKSIPRSLQMKSLRPKHLIAWTDTNWPAGQVSSTTRHNAMRAIQRALNWAKKLGHIESNPLAGVQRPPMTRRETYLWPEQYEKLLAKIRDQAFRDLVEFLRHTGCRIRELKLIEAEHFIPEDRCVILPAKLAKGRRKQRTILLNERAFGIVARCALEHPTGPVFRNSRGKPWRKNAIISRFDRLRKKLGFSATAYSLRHTFATDAILNGVDLVTIAKMMGHADLRMLSQVYEHVSQRLDHLRKGLDQATNHLQ